MYPHVCGHCRRHTFGTHTATRGTRLWVGQEVLGHTSRTASSLYVQLACPGIGRRLQENVLEQDGYQ